MFAAPKAALLPKRSRYEPLSEGSNSFALSSVKARLVGDDFGKGRKNIMASSDISTFGLVQGQGNSASTIKYFGSGRPPTMMMTTSNHRGYQNGDWERGRRPSGSRLLEGLMVHRRTDPHLDDDDRMRTERVAAITPPWSQQLPPKETTRPAAGIISSSSPEERCHRPPRNIVDNDAASSSAARNFDERLNRMSNF